MLGHASMVIFRFGIKQYRGKDDGLNLCSRNEAVDHAG